MNREGAETYLRLLGEAEMRSLLTAAPRPLWAARPGRGPGQADGGRSGPGRRRGARPPDHRGHPGRLRPGRERAAAPRADQPGSRPGSSRSTASRSAAGWNAASRNTANRGTSQPGHRQPGHRQPDPATLPAGTLPSRTIQAAAVAHLAAQIQFGRSGSLSRARRLARTWPAGSAGPPGPEDPEDPDHGPDQAGADRFVPIGLTIPFHDEGISGELHLMSFAHTGSGARFIAAWGMRTPSLRAPDGPAAP